MTPLLAFLLLATLSSEPEAPDPVLPSGWDQFDTQSMHGPEGWFHDLSSGAFVHYYAGPMPHLVGAQPEEGIPCSARQPLRRPPVPCLLNLTEGSLEVLIGPGAEQFYASYWSTIRSAHQQRRVEDLALANPLFLRTRSGHTMLDRKAEEADLRSVTKGMTIHEVLSTLGVPFAAESTSGGGFVVEFLVWRASSPGYVKLEFSRDRLLVSEPPFQTDHANGSSP